MRKMQWVGAGSGTLCALCFLLVHPLTPICSVFAVGLAGLGGMQGPPNFPDNTITLKSPVKSGSISCLSGALLGVSSATAVGLVIKLPALTGWSKAAHGMAASKPVVSKPAAA